MTQGSGRFSLVAPKRDAAVTHQVHVRWAVKTGGGPDVDLINVVAVTATTIEALTSQPPPAAWPPPGRVQPVETTVWELDATLVGYKFEQDRDYHLVLSDAGGRTMIAEIPDPSVVDPSSSFKAQITSARQSFDSRFGQQVRALAALAQPDVAAPMIVHLSVPVHVTGIGFFDFIHGQDGVAPNGVELHPVLSISF
jgi:hypothetical protein